MTNLNLEFEASGVFPFLKGSFQTLRPTHFLESKVIPSGLMRAAIVQVETPLWKPFLYATRVIQITEFSSVTTGDPLTYFFLRGFRQVAEAPIERISEISAHSNTFRHVPPGRFSWPVLMHAGDQNPELFWKVAMVIISVLGDLSRIVQYEPPKIHPDSFKHLVFSSNDSE